MRSLLICHDDASLDREGLARWLASFSDLAGVLVVTESRGAIRRRVSRQLKRVGILRFLDVLSFRLYYRLFFARKDTEWEEQELGRIRERYPAAEAKEYETTTPNSREAQQIIESLKPDILIARTKFMIKKTIFEIPTHGTFVLHPGICPNYRNAHGCFWALSNRDLDNVGLSLLRIDEGIDTGPVFGHYKYAFDEISESHHRIQLRCLYENLDSIAKKLTEIAEGSAEPLITEGRPSATWGQPWLTRYLNWKRRAREKAPS